MKVKFKDNSSYFKEILHAMEFIDYCKEQIALMPKSQVGKKVPNFDLEAAKAQLETLRSVITKRGMQMLMWMANKAFRLCFHGVFAEETGI